MIYDTVKDYVPVLAAVSGAIITGLLTFLIADYVKSGFFEQKGDEQRAAIALEIVRIVDAYTREVTKVFYDWHQQKDDNIKSIKTYLSEHQPGQSNGWKEQAGIVLQRHENRLYLSKLYFDMLLAEKLSKIWFPRLNIHNNIIKLLNAVNEMRGDVDVYYHAKPPTSTQSNAALYVMGQSIRHPFVSAKDTYEKAIHDILIQLYDKSA